MKYVEIYKLENDGSQSVIVTCKLVEDGQILCEGDKQFVDNLISVGINDYSKEGGSKLFPADGLPFLQQLQNNFKSGYLIATDVVG